MKKYILNEEIGIIDCTDIDMLNSLDGLTCVNEIDKDSLVFVISEDNNYKNEESYKNVILITNNVSTDMPYILCKTNDFNYFVLNTIKELILLFSRRGIINLDALDLIGILANKEVLLIKEEGNSIIECSEKLEKKLKNYDLTNNRSVITNFSSTENLKLVEYNIGMNNITKFFNKGIETICSCSLCGDNSMTLIIV